MSEAQVQDISTEDEADQLIESEVRARVALRHTINGLTHLGEYAPTVEEPTKEFSETELKQLVSDVRKYESELLKCIEAWCSFESRLTTDAQKELFRYYREQANEWLDERRHPVIPRCPQSPKRLDRVAEAEWTRKLEQLAEFSALKALFDEDNQAWEPYADRKRWLSLNESHTSNVKVKKKVEKEVQDARKKVVESKKKKEKLRDDILELFPVLRVSTASAFGHTPPNVSRRGGSKDPEGSTKKRKRADREASREPESSAKKDKGADSKSPGPEPSVAN